MSKLWRRRLFHVSLPYLNGMVGMILIAESSRNLSLSYKAFKRRHYHKVENLMFQKYCETEKCFGIFFFHYQKK
jgi:hypothetical protein